MESNVNLYALETLEKMIVQLKESEGMIHSKESCKLLLFHANVLRKSITVIISEIDKCCQEVSNVTLRRQFHEAKGNLLTKSGEFSQFFGEITSTSEGRTIDGDLLMSFLVDFEELVQHFKNILLMYEQFFIEVASAHINITAILLEKLIKIRLPDTLEAVFLQFSNQISTLWPFLSHVGTVIREDPRYYTVDAAYRELKYMCVPLSRALTTCIFHPSNKAMKDQKLDISKRVSSILMRLKSKLKMTNNQDEISAGYYLHYVTQVTNMLDEFRNKNISQPMDFLEELEYYLTEIVKYSAVLSYCPESYEECNAMTQAHLMLQKLKYLSQSLDNLDNDQPNERVNYFTFCRSYEVFLKRIDCCFAHQLLEFHSDPLTPIKNVISTIDDHCLDDISAVEESALKFNEYCKTLFVIGGFAIANSSPDKAKTLIQLLSTMEWIDDLMLPCATEACQRDENLLKLRVYGRIWAECATRCCSVLDELLSSKALIHIAVLKFNYICEALAAIRGESQQDIDRARIEIMNASKYACHLLRIQQVNPFYNSSQKPNLTKGLKSLRKAPETWDGSVLQMLECVISIEQIFSHLQAMDTLGPDVSLTSEPENCTETLNHLKTSLDHKDFSIIMNESASHNNTSIDLTRFLDMSNFSKSIVNGSGKNFSLNTQEITVNMKSVTKRDMKIRHKLGSS